MRRGGGEEERWGEGEDGHSSRFGRRNNSSIASLATFLPSPLSLIRDMDLPLLRMLETLPLPCGEAVPPLLLLHPHPPPCLATVLPPSPRCCPLSDASSASSSHPVTVTLVASSSPSLIPKSPCLSGAPPRPLPPPPPSVDPVPSKSPSLSWPSSCPRTRRIFLLAIPRESLPRVCRLMPSLGRVAAACCQRPPGQGESFCHGKLAHGATNRAPPEAPPTS